MKNVSGQACPQIGCKQDRVAKETKKNGIRNKKKLKKQRERPVSFICLTGLSHQRSTVVRRKRHTARVQL